MVRFCHPERSEGSPLDSSGLPSLRMTKKKTLLRMTLKKRASQDDREESAQDDVPTCHSEELLRRRILFLKRCFAYAQHDGKK